MLYLRIALHGADERRDADGACRAERVTQRDRTALRVDLLGIEIEGTHAGQGLGGEASLSSIQSRSSCWRPASLSARGMASTGPIPMIFGWHAGDAGRLGPAA
jgi:hypothetical protein